MKSAEWLTHVLLLLKLRPLTRYSIKCYLALSAPTVDYQKHFRESVVSLVKNYKARGHSVVLATASLRVVAETAVQSLPIALDGVIASDDKQRLKGDAKLTAILGYLRSAGVSGFVYVGDAWKDFRVMRQAQSSYFVGKRSVYFLGTRFLRIRGVVQLRK
jgi:phosphoserine phosphatase